MRLNDSASAPSSSDESTGTRVFQFPAATSRAASASCSTGRVTREDAHPLNRIARTMPTLPASSAAERMRLRNST